MVKMISDKPFWIFTELFYPDEVSSGFYLTEIARHLSKFNTINVVCGPSDYEKNSKQKSNLTFQLENIKIYRVWIPTLNKNNPVLRLIRLILLSFSFSIKMLFKVKKGEKILAVTNPALFIPIASLIAKIKGISLIVLVHDVFPENLIPIKASNKNSFFYKTTLNIFNKAYQNCNEIIVLGRDMKSLFERKVGNLKVNIEIIENWADLEQINIDDDISSKSIYNIAGIENKIIIQFAGNMGILQGLGLIVDFIKNCKNPLLHFMFIGEGSYKSELINNTKHLQNITVLNSFNRDQQHAFLNAADIGLVSLNDKMVGLGVPSKTYNLLAAGKPILYFGNSESEISLLIKENNLGWCFEFSENEKIQTFLNNLDFSSIEKYKFVIREIAEKYYSKSVILSKYEKYLY